MIYLFGRATGFVPPPLSGCPLYLFHSCLAKKDAAFIPHANLKSETISGIFFLLPDLILIHPSNFINAVNFLNVVDQFLQNHIILNNNGHLSVKDPGFAA